TSIAAPELLVPLGPVAEPFSKLGARRNLLEPAVHGERFLPHSSRPQTLDQESLAVCRLGRLVCALDPDHRPSTRCCRMRRLRYSARASFFSGRSSSAFFQRARNSS